MCSRDLTENVTRESPCLDSFCSGLQMRRLLSMSVSPRFPDKFSYPDSRTRDAFLFYRNSWSILGRSGWCPARSHQCRPGDATRTLNRLNMSTPSSIWIHLLNTPSALGDVFTFSPPQSSEHNIIADSLTIRLRIKSLVHLPSMHHPHQRIRPQILRFHIYNNLQQSWHLDPHQTLNRAPDVQIPRFHLTPFIRPSSKPK